MFLVVLGKRSWTLFPCFADFNLTALGANAFYSGPSSQDNCGCSTVLYSMVSACAACQNADWEPYVFYPTTSFGNACTLTPRRQMEPMECTVLYGVYNQVMTTSSCTYCSASLTPRLAAFREISPLARQSPLGHTSTSRFPANSILKTRPSWTGKMVSSLGQIQVVPLAPALKAYVDAQKPLLPIPRTLKLQWVLRAAVRLPATPPLPLRRVLPL